MAADYKDLKVWQSSRAITKSVYLLCAQLPKEEVYGLSSQMKRAAISVPSNIAEGYRRNSKKELLQFLKIASGSAGELETQLILVTDIFDINTDALQKDLVVLQKMLTSFKKSLG